MQIQVFHGLSCHLPYIVDMDSVKIEISNNLGLRMIDPRCCRRSEVTSFYVQTTRSLLCHVEISMELLSSEVPHRLHCKRMVDE